MQKVGLELRGKSQELRLALQSPVGLARAIANSQVKDYCWRAWWRHFALQTAPALDLAGFVRAYSTALRTFRDSASNATTNNTIAMRMVASRPH